MEKNQLLYKISINAPWYMSIKSNEKISSYPEEHT